MRDSRKGECLWQEWTGEGFVPVNTDAVVFYTDEHVDVEHEVVRRALASALQREGIAASLGNGYGAIDSANIVQGYAGEIEGSRELHACDEEGETHWGDIVDEIASITWVEVQ